MLATLVTILAQNSQDAPDEGVGIGLILLGVLIAVIIAAGIFMVFTKGSKARRGMAPDREPQRPGRSPTTTPSRDPGTPSTSPDR